MKKEHGQVVILLLLIMVVALAIGLSTIGRSILEVSTSRKSEDSSRAFSAAEAGIEKALKQNENNLGGTIIDVGNIALSGNQSGATVQGYALPVDPYALSFDKVTKRDFAQFWLADPNDPTVQGYTGTSFDIYFGNPDTNGTVYDPNNNGNPVNQPAIEVNVIYWDGTKYLSLRKNYDSFDSSRFTVTGRPGYGFSPCGQRLPAAISVDDGIGDSASVSYYCKVTITFNDPGPNQFTNSTTTFPVMARVRLLYTDTEHPIALQPIAGEHFPKQANKFRSSGTSGSVQRTLEVKNYRSVMPQLFDYVLFSAKDLVKD